MSEQLSEAWRLSRHGLITASRADQLVMPKTGKVSASAASLGRRLALEVHLGRWIDESGSTWAMERGIELEAVARTEYEAERLVEVIESGFIASGQIGCSPDGLVGADGGVEIKNPLVNGYTEAAEHIDEHGTVPSAYIAQCRLSLMVTDRAWWDCVVHYPGAPLAVARLERDAEAEALMQAGIDACLKARDVMLERLRRMSGIEQLENAA